MTLASGLSRASAVAHNVPNMPERARPPSAGATHATGGAHSAAAFCHDSTLVIMNPFNKKKDKLLIDLVKTYPVLYDPLNPNFKNCIVKHKVWECISATMDISIPDLKKRWKHFRDHYQKKLRAENAGLKSMHTWEYKTHLSFLTEFSNQKDKTKEDSDPDEPESQEEVFMPDSDIPVQSVLSDHNALDIDDANTEIEQVDVIPRKKRKKMDTLATVLENRLAERFRFETFKSEKSPIHKFFESMADIVAEFPPHLAAETRLKVCQVVNEVEMKKHTEQHYM